MRMVNAVGPRRRASALFVILRIEIVKGDRFNGYFDPADFVIRTGWGLPVGRRRPESTWSCHSGPRRQSGRERQFRAWHGPEGLRSAHPFGLSLRPHSQKPSPTFCG
jgi:hypothetical protein